MSSVRIRSVGRALIASLAVAVIVASCGGGSSPPAWTNGMPAPAPDGAAQPGLIGTSDPDGSLGPGLTLTDSGSASGGGDVVSTRYDSGPLGCPLYTKLCGGTCIPLSVDPHNCGDCGKTCVASEICSAGTCVPASRGCIPAPQGGDPALTVCGQSCVDTLNDSNNCGPPTGTSACGHKCGAMQGCVNGVCVPQVPVGTTPPATCGECFRDIARSTFRWALCSCGNVALGQQLMTDAYDSTKGPYPPNPRQLGGGVGVNGNFTSAGAAVNIGGALWCSGPTGVATNSAATVSQETHVANSLSAAGGTLRILDNAWVGGNVSGAVNVAKTLYVSPTAAVAGGVTAAATVKQPVTVAPPCDCSDTALLGQSINQIVAAHATNNDNAVIGLNAAALATPSSTSIRLALRPLLSDGHQPGWDVRHDIRPRGDVALHPGRCRRSDRFGRTRSDRGV